MLHRPMRSPLIFLAFFLFLLLLITPADSSFTSSALPQAAPAKHGLTGSYYAANTSLENDVPDKVFISQGVFYSQVWSDKNDFELPRPLRNLQSPMAGRVDPQVAFGQGKGFIGKREGPSMIWWPAGFPVQPGSFGNNTKPWENLAAVIWKGYIRLPKAGTYYFTTVSNGASAVYLNQARVALNGHYGGALVSDAFSYAKEDVQDFVQNLSGGNAAFPPNPGGMYVIPVPTDAPRDLPIQVVYNPLRHFTHATNDWYGIDLFWVTPDSPRDANGKPIAKIVPADALYAEPPGPIEKPAVRSANSTISADFLYFPVELADKDVTLTIRLADKDGHSVAGKRVYVSSMNNWGPDTIIQPEKPTDENGVTTARLRPFQNPHDSTIFATDLTDLVDAAQVAHVTFQSLWNTLIPEGFSPYFDPRIPSLEPLPLRAGRPVTITMPLANRNTFAVEVTATFSAAVWNIGSAGASDEIGKVKNITLQPREHKDVSISWTPKEASHFCITVLLSGHAIVANMRRADSLVAALLPTSFVNASSAPPSGDTPLGRQTHNFGPVEPPPPCPETLPPIVGPIPGRGPGWGDPLGDEDTVWVFLGEGFGQIYYSICTPSRKWKNFGKKWSKTFKDESKGDCSRALAEAMFDIKTFVERKNKKDACEDKKQTAQNADRLAHHPPDPTYRLAVAQADTPAAYLDAWRVSWERYDAALTEGDKEWMAKQATAIHLYMQHLAAALRRDADAMQKEADKLSSDDSNMTAQLQAEQQRLKDWLQQGAPLTPDQLKRMQAAGFTEEQVKDTASLLLAEKEAVVLKSDRALDLETSALYRQAADEVDNLDASPTAREVSGQPGLALLQTYTVGNPHDKQENVDLFIRPISIPPDWKLSVVNAEAEEANPQAAKPGGGPPQFPIREVEAGKHYAVTLPAKGQVKVASVVIPVGEVGAHTTARWAVEGKISDELIGGMMHEMNVPYIIADLQLPPVGSKEVEEELPAPSKAWARAVAELAAAILLLGVLAYFFLFRRRRRRTGTPAAS